jgi:hypothetical protein
LEGIPAPLHTVAVHPAVTHVVASQNGIVPVMTTSFTQSIQRTNE